MLLIVRVHLDLIVSRESIHERHPFKPARIVDHDIHDRKREFIFKTSFILITKINANPDLTILLGDGDNISYPIRVLLFPDEIRVYKFFDFRLNCFHNLWAKLSSLLLDGLYIRINVEAMHSQLRIKPKYILIVSSKNIYIFSHETY